MREVATVIVTSPVDGTRTRRRSTGTRRPSRRLATPIEGFTVHPDVMTAAKAALRPGERLVIVGPDVVHTVRA
jgi:hypothetical protein